MNGFDLVCYLVAAICFGVAALKEPTFKYYLVALGLFAWVLVPLVVTIRAT